MTSKLLENRCSDIYNELSPEARKAYHLYTDYSSIINRYGGKFGDPESSTKIANAYVDFESYCGKNPQIRSEIEKALQKAEALLKEAERENAPAIKTEATPTPKKSSTRFAKIGLTVSLAVCFLSSFALNAFTPDFFLLNIIRGVSTLACWVFAGIWAFIAYKEKHAVDALARKSIEKERSKTEAEAKQKENLAPVLSAIKNYEIILGQFE